MLLGWLAVCKSQAVLVAGMLSVLTTCRPARKFKDANRGIDDCSGSGGQTYLLYGSDAHLPWDPAPTPVWRPTSCLAGLLS